jgi:ribosomal protein S18 acetylase RimI-like enzyme
MITVCDAKQSDIDALVSLLGYLFAQEAEFSVDPSKQAAGLKLILDEPAIGQILVARKDGIVVGMVNLLFTVSTALGQRVAILDDLVVNPATRGSGVGKILLDAALNFCNERGFGRVSLQTDFDNHIAQRLYESIGFVRSSMLAYRKIL